MKTERRHDLETNTLALRLTGWIEKLKPHTGMLVGVLVILCGVAVVSSFWAAESEKKNQTAWAAFAAAHSATDPELTKLREVADQDEYSGTSMQEWAYVTWADRQVLLASGDYLIDRKSADDRLKRVVGIYEGLSNGVADAVVQNRARFGLARVFEMQNKLEEAREQYSQVGGDLQPMAILRAEQLDSSKVQEACAWLASAELPRRSFDGAAGGSGTRPSFDASLPDASLSESSDEPDPRSLEEILGTAGEKEAASDERYPADAAEENTEENTEESSEESEAPQDEEEGPAESNSSESAEVEETEAEVEKEIEAEVESAEEVETEADADTAE